MKLNLFSFFLLFGSNDCAVLSLGSCPGLRGVPDFQVLDYTGRWHEMANTWNLFDLGGTCVRATYSDRHDGSIGVFNEEIVSEAVVSINGSAIQPDKSHAELIVNFDQNPVPETTPNYFVLDTDYESYSIVYDCFDLWGVAKAESIWFLTRKQHPDQSLVDLGYLIMSDLGLPVDSVIATPQTNCDILP